MTQRSQSRIHDFIAQCLEAHHDEELLDDGESLFLSGRLDSMAVTQLVVFLEEQFSIDFGQEQFDVATLDSVELIAQFVERNAAAAAE
jgi:acyl carrier protein